MRDLKKVDEKYVKGVVKKALRKFGAYYHMPVQQGYGAPTLDFVGCMRGDFFAVETKRPGKHPTARQLLTIDTMRAAGATVFVIGEDVSEDEFMFAGMEELYDWLRMKYAC